MVLKPWTRWARSTATASRALEQLSEAPLQLNEGTVYASLLRLTQKG
jgi:hypothetical protein